MPTQMAEDAHRLLSLQLAYEHELDNKFQFAGLSVNDFISRLLSEGFGKRAEKVRADWKVPDKRYVYYLVRKRLAEYMVGYHRFWWIKLKALAGNKDWEGLENFAKAKKSPIGYEPFVVGSQLNPPEVLAEVDGWFLDPLVITYITSAYPSRNVRTPM
jgi:hypothetical protein